MKSNLPSFLTFAEFCRDPDKAKLICTHTSNTNPNPAYIIGPHWNDNGLSGYPALLIFFATLDSLFPSGGWDDVAHTYVLKIKNSLETYGINASSSMYEGLTAVCFAIQLASHQGTRYQRMLAKLNVVLLENVQQNYLIPFEENLKSGRSVPVSVYDLIQGVVGIGQYCLMNLSDPSLRVLTESIIPLLIQLTCPIKIKGYVVPGWYLSSENQLTFEDRQNFLEGNFNTGLAHGISGVLAFLAIAKIRGIVMPGQVDAIYCISNWLKARRSERDELYNWQGQLPFEKEIKSFSGDIDFNRKAWCYGTPGVTRSLYLAGKALEEEKLKEFAIDSFRSIFQNDHWGLPGPTICHGISGLLLISHFMAKDSRDPYLQTQTEKLVQKLWTLHDPISSFGFCDLDPKLSGGFASIHKAGLLEGAAGVWLTLLTTDPAVKSHLESKSLTSSLETKMPPWHFPFLVNHE